MKKPADVILQLLEALIKEWDEAYSIEEVACDELKVDILLNALSAEGPVSEHVRNFYKKVFLRDVWDRDATTQ